MATSARRKLRQNFQDRHWNNDCRTSSHKANRHAKLAFFVALHPCQYPCFYPHLWAETLCDEAGPARKRLTSTMKTWNPPGWFWLSISSRDSHLGQHKKLSQSFTKQQETEDHFIPNSGLRHTNGQTWQTSTQHICCSSHFPGRTGWAPQHWTESWLSTPCGIYSVLDSYVSTKITGRKWSQIFRQLNLTNSKYVPISRLISKAGIMSEDPKSLLAASVTLQWQMKAVKSLFFSANGGRSAAFFLPLPQNAEQRCWDMGLQNGTSGCTI